MERIVHAVARVDWRNAASLVNAPLFRLNGCMQAKGLAAICISKRRIS